MRSHNFAVAVVVSIVLLFTARPAWAIAYVATGGGSWNVSTTWSPNGIPGSGTGDSVTISGPAVTMNYAMPNDLVGFTNSGTLNFSAGANLRLGLGTHTSSGAMNVSAGSLTLNGATLSLAPSSQTTFSNSTITGSGTTACAALCGITIGNGVTFNQGNINVLGTLVFNASSGNLVMNNSAAITIGSGGVFDAQHNASLHWAAGGQPSVNISSGGTLKKTTISGTTSFGLVLLNNDGTVDSQLGAIQVPAGTSTGTFTATAPHWVDFNSATHTSNGATITGDGVRLTGGVIQGTSLTIATGATLTWSAGSMTGAGNTIVNSGATLMITGAVTLNQRTLDNDGTVIFASNGGTMSTGNSATINNNLLWDDQNNADTQIFWAFGGQPNFNNGGTLKKTVGPSKTSFTGGTLLNNSGTVDAQTGTISIVGGNSSGLFTASGTGVVSFASGTHTMSGASIGGVGGVHLEGSTFVGASLTIPANATLTWSSGSMGNGSTSEVTTIATNGTLLISGAVTQNGRIINNSGTIDFASGGATYSVGNSAALNNLAGGLFDDQNSATTQMFWAFGGLPNFNNAGLMQKNGAGTTKFTGGFQLNNSGTVQAINGSFEIVGGNSSGLFTASAPGLIAFKSGTHTMSGATIGGTGGVHLDGATFIGANLTIPSGATLNWLSGSMGNGAIAETTTVDAGGTLLISGAVTHNGRTINNNGDVVFNSGGGTYNIGNSAAFNNSGTFKDENAANTQIFWAFGGVPSFNNSGMMKKDGPAITSFTGGALLNNSGTVEAIDGTWSIVGGSSSGLFTATAPGVVTFNSGTHTMNGATIGGAGNVKLNGCVFNGPSLTIPNGATLTWLAGKMSGTNTDVTTIASGGTLYINGTVEQNARIIDNFGLVTFASSGNTFNTGNSSVFHNEASGVFDAQNAANTQIFWSFGGLPSFNNDGLFKKTTTGAGITSFTGGILFNNTGTADAQVGMIRIAGGTSSGTFTAAAPATIEFNGGTHTMNGASITGDGVTLNGATINGTGFTILNGAVMTWLSGSMNGSSTAQVTTINSGGTLDIAGPATLNSRRISNNGTVIFSSSGGTFSLGNSAIFDNNATGIFDAQNPANTQIFWGFGGQPQFNNLGTFKKTGAAGTTTTLSSFPFTNTGTVDAQAGTIALGTGTSSGTFNALFGASVNFVSGSHTLAAGNSLTGAGKILLAGGSITAPSGLNINGGTLGGSGTVTGNVTNNGTVAPGTSAGGLTVSGNYTMTASGILDIELAGTTPVSTYDRLNVSGTANLNGTLNVTLIGGYTPVGGETYAPLLFTTRVGDFIPPKNLPTFAGGGSFTASYSGSSLVLTAIVTADLGITQTSSVSTALHGQNVVYTITATNNAFANATNVVVTNTFSNAGFVSVSTTLGTCTGTGPVTCTITTLPVGNSATITLTLNANTLGTMSNNATVTSNDPDPNTANNSSTVNVTVNPGANLSLGITDAPDPVNPGANTTYTVTINNAGPDPATNATVAFTMSGGSILSSTSGSFTCSGTGASSSCTTPSLASGTTTITVIGKAGASGTMMLNAAITSTTGDPTPGSESASQATAINATDVAITKSGPSTAAPNATITYTIVVTNIGPMNATSVVVNDTPPARLTFVSNSGACTTNFPCNVGPLGVGQSATILAKFKVAATGTSTFTNTATVASVPADPNTSNNTSSKTTSIDCPTGNPNTLSPAAGATGVATSGTLIWTDVDAILYRVFLGPAGSGCSIEFASSGTTNVAYSGLAPGTDYEWRVEAVRSGCPVRTSSCSKFRTATSCNAAAPTLISPANGSTALSPIEFKWSAVNGATKYEVFASAGVGSPQSIGTTTETSLTASIDDGTVQWYVIASVPDCGPLQSATGQFNNCNRPDAPVARVVGEATSGQTYKVEWDAVIGAIRYEIDEADNSDFLNAQTKSTVAMSAQFTHLTEVARAFHYRVRAFSACAQQGGPYSTTIRVVIIPLPPKSQQNPSVNVPAGSTEQVVQEVFIPGVPGQTLTFTASVDREWLFVTPASGELPPSGVLLRITAKPGELPNGTFTATVIVVITTPSTSRYGTTGSTTVSVPVSVNLVTPVTPVTKKTTPPPDTLIIPSVGHLDGINSHWQSDIRVTNVAGALQKYALTFVPADPKSGTKQTNIEVQPGATTALDDIVRNWYGIGTLGDSANGVLEIRPLTQSKGLVGDAVGVSKVTVVSSRTYNVTSNGTLGQFIPAIPFASFIGKPAQGLSPVLSLQQLVQSKAFRTNVGLIEASGQSASVLLSVFSGSGQKLLELPFNLAANQQLQLNGFLAQNNISLNDGRIELRVTKGEGRVTAYASTIDNVTNDPLLVAPVQLGLTQASKWVLPGVADLVNPIANWRTDMRVFNSGTTPQTATLTFLPQGGQPSTATLTIAPAATEALDNVVATLFGKSNVGGVVHVTTPTDSGLVVTGRTYNQTGNGTFGQFIPAVTVAEAAGVGSAPLHVLQVEDSTRFRTNLGIAEVTGKPVTVEVQVILPDSKVTPTVRIPLAADEFRQLAIIRELGLGNVYNARIAVRVVEGEGKVTAYGSIIDEATQDPMYVAAQ